MERLRAFVQKHPRLASWAVLALGMIVLFLIGVGVAGLCAWIIGWEPQ